MKEKYYTGDKEVIRRLDLLLQDVCKQYCARMNRSKRKYADVMGNEGEASTSLRTDVPVDMPPVSSASDPAWKKAVILYLVDPEVDPTPAGGLGHPKVGGKYEWVGDSEIGVLYEPTLSDIWKLFAQYVPDGRHVREIWGAMSTPIVDAGGSRLPAEMQYLDTTQKVDGFFMLTQLQPIYLMAILSTLEGPNTRPNSPPPPRRAYLDPDKFAPSETYKKDLEDEDELISRCAGLGKKHLPWKNKAFE